MNYYNYGMVFIIPSVFVKPRNIQCFLITLQRKSLFFSCFVMILCSRNYFHVVLDRYYSSSDKHVACVEKNGYANHICFNTWIFCHAKCIPLALSQWFSHLRALGVCVNCLRIHFIKMTIYYLVNVI